MVSYYYISLRRYRRQFEIIKGIKKTSIAIHSKIRYKLGCFACSLNNFSCNYLECGIKSIAVYIGCIYALNIIRMGNGSETE